MADLGALRDFEILEEAALDPGAVVQVEVAFVDLDARVDDPAGLIDEIRARCPNAAILAFTSSSSPGLFRSVLAEGVRGYLLKQETTSPDRVVEALRAVASGGTYFSAGGAELLGEIARNGSESRPYNLTLRELEIMGHLANGMSNRLIAERLSITPQGVKNHLRRMFPKLGVTNRTEAALLAQREGLSPKPDTHEGPTT